jgi:hypothetical protein
MTRLFLAVLLGSYALGACATKRLPPGTPPPEYETRAIPPWPPATPSSSVAPTESGPPAAESPDAGSTLDAASAAPGPSPDAGSE